MDINVSSPAQAFRLRAGAIIIENERLLTVRHDLYDGYYTVGGRIRLGESSEEAILREAYEETGLPLKIDRLLFIHESFFPAGGRAHHEVCFYYLMQAGCTVPDGAPTDQRGERLFWLPLQQLPDLPLVPSFLRTALQQLPEQPVHLITAE